MIPAFRCVVADPPWAPKDALPGASRGAARNYRVLTTPEICGYLADLGAPVAEHAMLFLWRLASMQQDALDVATAWGFRVVSEVVWAKRTKLGLPWFGMGRTVRAAHETALVCVRGRASKVRRAANIRSVFEAPVPLDEEGNYLHSAKPDAFFTEIVEPLVGGPYLELFARRRRAGWWQAGDQLPRGAQVLS